jgi:hypothetical protein
MEIHNNCAAKLLNLLPREMLHFRLELTLLKGGINNWRVFHSEQNFVDQV